MSTQAKEFDFWPNILLPSEVRHFEVGRSEIEQIVGIMTPVEIMEKKDFVEPEIINPEKYPNFEVLMKYRDRIRRLELLPVKSDYQLCRYRNYGDEAMLRRVKGYLSGEEMSMAVDYFPNNLPEDLVQYMIWVSERGVDNNRVVSFMAKCFKALGVWTDQVILFERPLNVTTRFVKGSFPQKRHIHCWVKIFAGEQT